MVSLIFDIRRIVRHLYQVAGDITLWCWAHDPPFGWLGDFFLEVYNELTDLHEVLYQLAADYSDLWERVVDIITESDIFRVLQTWLNYAEDAWNWVLYAFSNVVAIVDVWWQATRITVQGWIETATQGFNELKVAWDEFWQITFPNWTTELLRIGSELSDFFTVTLPTLIDWKALLPWWLTKLIDIGELIKTAFVEREAFWAGWQDWKDKVTEFFTDPFEWIKTNIIDPIVDDFNRGFDRGMKGGEE